MPTRIVKTRIDKPFSSLPWSGAKVVFSLVGSAYDATRQVPSFTTVAKADEAGNLQVALETTTDKENECYWQATLPDGESFRFSLPTGTGDLQLSFLRQSGEIEPSTPVYNAVAAYVDAAINSQAAYKKQLLAVTSSNQTAFNLSAIPALPHLSLLFVNGEKSRYPQDYAINSSVLNWNNRVRLDSSDEVEFYYL